MRLGTAPAFRGKDIYTLLRHSCKFIIIIVHGFILTIFFLHIIRKFVLPINLWAVLYLHVCIPCVQVANTLTG